MIIICRIGFGTRHKRLQELADAVVRISKEFEKIQMASDEEIKNYEKKLRLEIGCPSKWKNKDIEYRMDDYLRRGHLSWHMKRQLEMRWKYKILPFLKMFYAKK